MKTNSSVRSKPLSKTTRNWKAFGRSLSEVIFERTFGVIIVNFKVVIVNYPRKWVIHL